MDQDARALLLKYLKRRQFMTLLSTSLMFLFALGSGLFSLSLKEIGAFFLCYAIFFLVLGLFGLYTAFVRYSPKNSLLLGEKFGNWEVKSIHFRKLRTIYLVSLIIPIFWTVNYQILVRYSDTKADALNVNRKDVEAIIQYLNQQFPGKVFVG